SHTVFSFYDYGDAPADLAGRLGIPFTEWEKVKELRVMRASIMTPYLTKSKIAEDYWEDYLNSMKRKLAEIINR
ncbi:MAG: tyrosine decarboxylase, partial [Bacteroidia bacterium]|nr:tyrosine decarboxylase [Bacteroidia bacterium]